MKKIVFILAVAAALAMTSCHKTQTLADLPSHYITLDGGARMHYKVCGKGNITLMFVHGFGCDMNAWEQQYEGFRNDTIRMIFVDLPGYGKSDKPDTNYTLSYFADALHRVADTLGATKLVLIGHSLGTPICRQFVFDHPTHAAALCDIDGVYCFYPTEANERESYSQQIDQFVETFHGDDIEQNITAFVESLAGPFTPQEVQDYAMSTMPKTHPTVAYSTMKNLVDPTYWDGEKINIPTLIICTRNSDIPQNNRQLMDGLYNDATYMEFDNTGHFIMMEDAAIVNDLIERSYERWRKTEPEVLR